MSSLFWAVYQVAVAKILLLAGPFLLLHRGAHYLTTLSGRLGGEGGGSRRGDSTRPGEGQPQPLWLHAVSVGEVGVASTLARALPRRLPLLVTTITPTGQERARAAFGEAAFPGARVAYLPFDLGFATRRFFRRHRPAALVLVEGDYWPLVLAAARRRGLPVMVVNGRLSDRSFPRLRRFAPLVRRLMLDRVDHFGVQTEGDRDRLVALGVEPRRVTVTGNLKYETGEPALPRPLAEVVARTAAGRPILIAGSTMKGEEEQVLEAFRQVRGDALLLIAPRHPERFGEVVALLESAGLRAVRRSTLGDGSLPGEQPGEPPGEPLPEVLLLDTLGELAAVYRLARGAFIGGTLVPTGGHNPLEAARFGVPVAVGPSMENFRQMAEELDTAEAWHRVASGRELGALWRQWVDHPETARELGQRAEGLIEASRGALDKTLAVLAPVLSQIGALGHPHTEAARAGSSVEEAR